MPQVTLKRAQIKRGVTEGIDITVKSGRGMAAAFAPTWDMVTGHKSSRITDTEYTMEYYQILNDLHKDVWNWLYEQGQETGNITLRCYCPHGAFCHTHLLIEYICNNQIPYVGFKDKFRDGRADGIVTEKQDDLSRDIR